MAAPVAERGSVRQCRTDQIRRGASSVRLTATSTGLGRSTSPSCRLATKASCSSDGGPTARLRRSAWPLLLAAVREREKKLERMLADAARDREEAAALLAEHKRLVAAARAEAQELIAQARTVAEKERAALLAQAREQYEQLLARARKEIESEKEKAILELRREAVDLSIAAASKVIEANLDSEANRRLVMDYLVNLEAGGERAGR